MNRPFPPTVAELGGCWATTTEVPSCSLYVAWKVACSELVILSARSLMVVRLPARLLAAERKPQPSVAATATVAAAPKAIVRRRGSFMQANVGPAPRPDNEVSLLRQRYVGRARLANRGSAPLGRGR